MSKGREMNLGPIAEDLLAQLMERGLDFGEWLDPPSALMAYIIGSGHKVYEQEGHSFLELAKKQEVK